MIRARVAVAVLVLCTGCGAIQVQSSSRKEQVSINPCKLFASQRAAIERAAGQRVVEQLAVDYRDEESPRDTFSECRYESQTSDSVPFRVEVEDETKVELSHHSLGKSPRPIRGLGREATYNPRYAMDRDNEPHFVVGAVTQRGAQLVISLDARRGTEQTLLATMTALARPAIDRIDTIFPGRDRPPRDKAPVDVCSLVPEAEFESPPPKGEVFEVQYFGGNKRLGAGPVGGGWLCDSFADSDTAADVAWWVSKTTPTASALLTAGERAPGVGNAAVWLRRPGWWLGANVTLSILTAGGRHLEIEVGGDDAVASRRRVAVAVARRALARLP